MPKHLLIGAFLAACVAVHVYAKVTLPSSHTPASHHDSEAEPDGQP